MNNQGRSMILGEKKTDFFFSHGIFVNSFHFMGRIWKRKPPLKTCKNLLDWGEMKFEFRDFMESNQRVRTFDKMQ